MILEAFWKGDREELAFLANDEVRGAFEAAIDAREAAGQTLDNRLVAIERAAIEDARLTGKVAEIEVRFDAFVAAVTRNAEGKVIAGSLERRGADQRSLDLPPRPQEPRSELASRRDRRSRLTRASRPGACGASFS